MKLIKFIFTILPLCFLNSFGQGFDWQLDARMPYYISDFYIGGIFDYSTQNSFGKIPLFEGEYSCCDFTAGNGSQINIGLWSEYWVLPESALIMGLSYASASDNISSQRTIERIINPDFPPVAWKTEYVAQGTTQFLNLEFGAKHRFADLGLFLSLSSLFNIKISQEYSYKERVISPEYLPFADGSFERQMIDGYLPNSRVFNISPVLRAGWDIPLSPELYISPAFMLSAPLFNRFANHDWNDWRYGLTVTVSNGYKL